MFVLLWSVCEREWVEVFGDLLKFVKCVGVFGVFVCDVNVGRRGWLYIVGDERYIDVANWLWCLSDVGVCCGVWKYGMFVIFWVFEWYVLFWLFYW